MTYIDATLRDDLIEAERQAEKGGAACGLMAMVNEGFWLTMNREVQIALVLDHSCSVIRLTGSLLQVRDENDNLLGEWVPLEKAEKLKDQENVHFLSRDFVLYRDIPLKGAPRIVLPAVDFPFLHGIEGIVNVTSASPSGPTDELIRCRLGLGGTDLLSHVVGFDLDIQPSAERVNSVRENSCP
ncbi:MAG: hypothetical protein GX307_00650 [Euryarchaeota archaeon]|nr:hypothetical protein [Euryarchaeota archaeon]